jgi:hypothetical protein
MAMKVFFGGSLPRFKTNKEDYLAIRKVILDLKHKLTRDWINEEIKGRVKRSHHQMYELTEKAIKEADSVILEYSHDISAIGQQLTLSLERGLPTLLLVKDSNETEDSPLSDWFISSKHYKYIRKERYRRKYLRKIISSFLKWVEENKRLVRFNLEIERELDNYLKEKAKQNKTSKSEEIRKLILESMQKFRPELR